MYDTVLKELVPYLDAKTMGKVVVLLRDGANWVDRTVLLNRWVDELAQEILKCKGADLSNGFHVDLLRKPILEKSYPQTPDPFKRLVLVMKSYSFSERGIHNMSVPKIFHEEYKRAAKEVMIDRANDFKEALPHLLKVTDLFHDALYDAVRMPNTSLSMLTMTFPIQKLVDEQMPRIIALLDTGKFQKIQLQTLPVNESNVVGFLSGTNYSASAQSTNLPFKTLEIS